MSIPTITPGLLYHDAHQAIEWLCHAFGFEKRTVIPGDGNRIRNAHLTLGNGGIMLSSAEGYPFSALCKSPRELGGVGSSEIIVDVPDPDAHCQRAVAAGAEIVIPVEDKPYGGRGYSCKDPEALRLGVWLVQRLGRRMRPEFSARGCPSGPGFRHTGGGRTRSGTQC